MFDKKDTGNYRISSHFIMRKKHRTDLDLLNMLELILILSYTFFTCLFAFAEIACLNFSVR